jgi:hypothetical protein
MARTAPMTGAFPRLDPELRRLRLYRIELIDMHAKHKASDCYLFLFTQSMHGTEQTIEAYVIFYRRSKEGGIVCRVALL